MAARDYGYLSNFSLEYKKAFARQQGVSKQVIDTLTADGTAKRLDDYLNENFDICDQYTHRLDDTPFLHRSNTYRRLRRAAPRKRFCEKCDLQGDVDYTNFYGMRSQPEVEKNEKEGDEPMTPENYTRYDEILKEEKKRKREEEQRKVEEEEQRKREEEQSESQRETMKAKYLKEGMCPVSWDQMDYLEISKVCGHGVSPKTLEQSINSKCPVCRRPDAFREGNTELLPTQQGEKKRARIIELCKKGMLTAGACAAAAAGAAAALPYFTGGKKTRRRKHKKSAKKNKTKHATTKTKANTKTKTKVKKGRKNKTKHK